MAPSLATLKLTRTMLGITMIAALAGLLLGYNVAVISGAMIFIKHNFIVSATVEGLIVSAVPFGALVAAAICGKFNDIFGRRDNLLFAAVFFIIGILGCTFAPDIISLVLARAVVGVAVGIGSFSAPLYIAELSAERYRGSLVTLNQLAIVIGILLAYLVNFLFTKSGAWRYMFLCSLLPALLLFILAWKLPKSPRWLMLHGKIEQVKGILLRLHGYDEAYKEFKELQQVIYQEKGKNSDKLNRYFFKALWVGVSVSILTQAIGINAIIYYAPTIFKLTGFDNIESALLATVGIGAINVLFTLVAVWLLNSVGRRRLLLIGMLGIIISLVLLVIGLAESVNSHMIFGWLMFFAVILFVTAQAISTGPLCWLIPTEIFPAKTRGIGMGLSVAFNWATNFVIALLFPIVLVHWGGRLSFEIFLVIAVITWVYFYKYFPETKGCTLERIEKNLYLGKRLRNLGDPN